MQEFLPWINGISITAALGAFLWWKTTIHKEIVEPSVNAVQTSLTTRIDYLETRVAKTEELYLRMQDNLEHKIDKLQEAVSVLTKEVAELTGQLKAMQK